MEVLLNLATEILNTRYWNNTNGGVYTRLERVLALLVEGKDSNNLVENKRG